MKVIGKTFAFGVTSCILGLFSSYVASNVEVISRDREEDSSSSGDMMLFDFKTATSVADWTEMSDTVRTVGMSKATLVLQQTQVFQRAIFFTLLNPQPNGAAFAGVRNLMNLDLSAYQSLKLRARAQGENVNYKMVLRHRGEDKEPYPTYENFFTAPQGHFAEVELPLDNFVAYYRGRPLNSTEAEPLDRARVTSIGLQVYGGVYSPTKQAGPGTLELDWIKAAL